MSIIHEVLDSLDGDATLRDLSVCLRVTAVWSRGLGLAYTFPRERHSLDRRGDRPAKRLFESSPRELAGLALSRDLTEASIGVAAINSLVTPKPEQLRRGKAHELIMELGRDKSVTVVGHFPFVERIEPHLRRLWVLDQNPRGEDLPADEASNVIPESDIVAITGTALINGTLDELLELARGKYTMVVGPSTVMTPTLFDYGVDAVCGSVVIDPELALKCVREGSSFRHTDGIEPVIMAPSRARG